MKVCHSNITPRLDHFRAKEHGTEVSIMAVGHLICVTVSHQGASALVEMVSFADFAKLLLTIPTQPDRKYNQIP
jgi:hypothetical protein